MQTSGAEVDQQSDVEARGFQVAHELRLVYGKQVRHGFQFDDQVSFHEEVGHEIADDPSAELRGNRHLLRHADSGIRERDGKGVFVDLLEVAGTEFAMDVHRAPDHRSCESVVDHRKNPVNPGNPAILSKKCG